MLYMYISKIHKVLVRRSTVDLRENTLRPTFILKNVILVRRSTVDLRGNTLRLTFILKNVILVRRSIL